MTGKKFILWLKKGKWDKFNTNGALDVINESIGENIQTIRQFGKKNQAGEIMSVNDVLASTRSEAAIEAEIKIKQAQSDLLKGNTDKKSIDAKAKLDNERYQSKFHQ